MHDLPESPAPSPNLLQSAAKNEHAPEPIHAVLFDYGLVLSSPPDPLIWTHMRELTGLDEDQLARAYWTPRYDYDRGIHTGPEYWTIAGKLAELDLTAAQVEALLEADVLLWTQPNQPMIDWALRLQAAGTRTGILSNIGDAMSLGILRKLPWLTNFDHLTWSHTLKLAKPEAAIYAHAAAGLHTAPAHILFVDDRADNIAGSLAAGMQAIRYEAHAQFEREMEERGLRELWLIGKILTTAIHNPF